MDIPAGNVPDGLTRICNFCEKLVGLEAFSNDELAEEFRGTECSSPPIMAALPGFSETQLCLDYGLDPSEVKRTKLQLSRVDPGIALDETTVLFAGLVVTPREGTSRLTTLGGNLEIRIGAVCELKMDEVWVATCWNKEAAWLAKATQVEALPADSATGGVRVCVSLGSAATQEHRETPAPRCWPYVVLGRLKEVRDSRPGDGLVANCDHSLLNEKDPLVSSYIKANTAHSSKMPTAFRWSLGSPPLSSRLAAADFERWWECLKDALEKTSIESVETGASETLSRWDFERLACGDTTGGSNGLAAADTLTKNIEYIKKCMCWVPSQTGVGSWRVITKDLAKNKTHHGAAATKCCGRSLNDKILQSVDSATGLPNKVPCPP